MFAMDEFLCTNLVPPNKVTSTGKMVMVCACVHGSEHQYP